MTEGLYGGLSEAAYFARVAVRMGVPEDRILVEGKSTNTGENIDFTRALLRERGLDPRVFIVVQKPYMELRSLLTFRRRMPSSENKVLFVTSPRLSLEEYASSSSSAAAAEEENEKEGGGGDGGSLGGTSTSTSNTSTAAIIPLRTILCAMAGDLQRCALYSKPPRDFQAPVEIPEGVWEALRVLARAGYTDQLIVDEEATKEARRRVRRRGAEEGGVAGGGEGAAEEGAVVYEGWRWEVEN
jgi:hypothetical protein